MDDNHALTDDEIAALAPGGPAFYRANRYLGDNISATLSDFTPADRAIIFVSWFHWPIATH